MHGINRTRIQADVDDEVYDRFREHSQGLGAEEAIERAMLLWVELNNPEEMIEDVVR